MLKENFITVIPVTALAEMGVGHVSIRHSDGNEFVDDVEVAGYHIASSFSAMSPYFVFTPLFLHLRTYPSVFQALLFANLNLSC